MPAPVEHELQSLIDRLHDEYKSLSDGEVATYIPELGRANPEHFGICVVTADGRVFEAGDCDQPFTIQSISKPFTFGMALEEFGHERGAPARRRRAERRRVQLDRAAERHQPAVQPDGQLRRHHRHGAAARTLRRRDVRPHPRPLQRRGRPPLSIDQAVYESERRTGHRNRAIAHLLLNFGIVPRRGRGRARRLLQAVLDPRHLPRPGDDGRDAVEHGRNPLTGAGAFDMHSVKNMLSIMFTCGMYDYSGQWAYRVGVPAKSGVGGGVMAVVNRQLGIATYSPRLDPHGNSRRGIEVCVELASRLGLHVFDCLNVGSKFLGGILS